MTRCLGDRLLSDIDNISPLVGSGNKRRIRSILRLAKNSNKRSQKTAPSACETTAAIVSVKHGCFSTRRFETTAEARRAWSRLSQLNDAVLFSGGQTEQNGSPAAVFDMREKFHAQFAQGDLGRRRQAAIVSCSHGSWSCERFESLELAERGWAGLSPFHVSVLFVTSEDDSLDWRSHGPYLEVQEIKRRFFDTKAGFDEAQPPPAEAPAPAPSFLDGDSDDDEDSPCSCKRHRIICVHEAAAAFINLSPVRSLRTKRPSYPAYRREGKSVMRRMRTFPTPRVGPGLDLYTLIELDDT